MLLLPVEGDTTVLRGLERLAEVSVFRDGSRVQIQKLKPPTKSGWKRLHQLEALSVGSSGAPLLLRTLVAALSKVEDGLVGGKSTDHGNPPRPMRTGMWKYALQLALRQRPS